MIDIDALERLLIGAARDRRTLAYSDVLSHFGKRVTPIRVYALCRDLGAVSERNRERREPELAVLVVRKTDRLPGEGFFRAAWKDGVYDGPATGPRARAYIDGLTETVFDFFADAGRDAAHQTDRVSDTQRDERAR
ncbi:MAG: ribose-phosphate pyrophosphokinase [Pseudomonadota bacterium]